MPGIRLCRYERRAQRLCEMKKRNDRNTQTGMSADYHAPENDGEVVQLCHRLVASPSALVLPAFVSYRECRTKRYDSAPQRAQRRGFPAHATTVWCTLRCCLSCWARKYSSDHPHCLIAVMCMPTDHSNSSTHETVTCRTTGCASRLSGAPLHVLVDKSHGKHARKHEAISFSRNYENHVGRYSASPVKSGALV